MQNARVKRSSQLFSHKYITKQLAVRALTLVYKTVHTLRFAATPYS